MKPKPAGAAGAADAAAAAPAVCLQGAEMDSAHAMAQQ